MFIGMINLKMKLTRFKSDEKVINKYKFYIHISKMMKTANNNNKIVLLVSKL